MEIIEHSIQTFKKAIELENNGMRQEAINSYKNGIEELSQKLAFVKDESILSQCIDALKMYKDRVNLLEQQVQSKQVTSFPSSINKDNQKEYVMVQPTYQIPSNDYIPQDIYKISDDKDFDGQVDEILNQVYCDVKKEQLAQQKPIQKSLPVIPQKRTQQTAIDNEISLMENYLQQEESTQSLNQDERDAIYQQALQNANNSLELTQHDIKNIDRMIQKGKYANQQIKREEEKFDRLVAQSHQADEYLDLK
ncbi:hypothetical protein EDI_023840 [Entamoeba dispar SAW760]|uniref:Uncharacterized protein n=1 Tax=Entamoeba dispar (strain ATCC PRA-260 / SAW760) TaxID=370354 RepID=B0EHA7_ENTDS|nr:uncharacterized protein EDI_023840 [Entamoeba dispar SAW760]EDR26100.1 hypothetical protein EDI_023840 [Entamoeba dispar SAW760]|eukprot:EDR26100.1 hypothetical protein EDI_023840 [Entamoeba dispar SAW760]